MPPSLKLVLVRMPILSNSRIARLIERIDDLGMQQCAGKRSQCRFGLDERECGFEDRLLEQGSGSDVPAAEFAPNLGGKRGMVQSTQAKDRLNRPLADFFHRLKRRQRAQASSPYRSVPSSAAVMPSAK